MDRIAEWKKDAEERQRRVEAATEERRAEERAEQQAASEWRDYIANQIRTATMAAAKAIGEAVKESFDERDEQINALTRKVDRLEVALAKADAEIAKLTTRVIESEVNRERDRNSRDRDAERFVPPPRRSELN